MPLNITKRGKIWHYSGTVAGRRLRGTTETTDKRIAERIAAEVENKAWQSHLDGPGTTLTFAQAAIAYRQAGRDTRFLDDIEDYWKDTLVPKITGEAIRQMARKLYPEAANATRNRQGIVPAQAIINFASELEWCSPIKVKRFKVSAKIKTPVTRAWVEKFAAQAVQDELHHLAALCLFMFGTGARRGEACALKWSDVELFQKTAVINQTKVEHQRIAHLSPPVVGALANIPSNRNPENFVFSYASGESVGQVWKNVVKRAGIQHLSPHCCRHGFATSMLQAGVDPKTVAVRGGWKDVATVMKYYAHAMDDPTVTDVLFGTNLTQDKTEMQSSN
ncbi:site-specific integrase [uncultured Roseobacter sp.]|uniref:tyrosine-type recombinase/integrase n=1 Tax=uncultured Roseobacter sp. TaxID=114847 RepID=UPI0026127785|nr:site-specific integrase [uncultured Roseobacter sp.]